jgi:hypothetical protein
MWAIPRKLALFIASFFIVLAIFSALLLQANELFQFHCQLQLEHGPPATYNSLTLRLRFNCDFERVCKYTTFGCSVAWY